MKKVFVLICALALLGCQDIREKPFTKENQAQFYAELRNKLTEQEKKDLAHYIESTRFSLAESGQNPPANDYELIQPGHTFKDIMRELEDIKKDEAEQNKLAELYKKHEKELQDAVTVKPLKKWVDESGLLNITYKVFNNTDKPLKAYQGKYFFNDVFGDSLLEDEIKLNLKKPLSGGFDGEVTYDRPYNPSMDKFISTDFVDMKKEQKNDTVIFLDGSKLPRPMPTPQH